jgi:hypothetical protein
VTARGYARYAWVIVLISGLVDIATALYLVVNPVPLDSPGIVNLTGMSWSAIQSQSPAAAKLTSYFVGIFGVQETYLGLFTAGLAVTGMRKGAPWAWNVLWIAPIAFLSYAASNYSIGGTTWTLAVVDALIAIVGLMLSYRVFFPKKIRAAGN